MKSEQSGKRDRPGLSGHVDVTAYRDGAAREISDDLATEEPLEIRLLHGATMHRAGVTMRTPGADFELAAGFLLSEGTIARREEIAGMSYCVDPALDAEQHYNIVNVTLARAIPDEVFALERHFTAGSACGICGTATIEALQVRAQPIEPGEPFAFSTIARMSAQMQDKQRVFRATGGLHAAALFDRAGTMLALREDVGRHNALDKAVGWALMNGRVPLRDCVALVSGRASYELVQKCIVAGACALAAVSAPSTLAVRLAREFNLTLIGFLREGRANVYSGAERVDFEA